MHQSYSRQRGRVQCLRGDTFAPLIPSRVGPRSSLGRMVIAPSASQAEGLAMHQVFLIPGFFGFSSLGRLKYFNGVGDIIRAEFERRGIAARVVEIDTLPTASIRRRA